MKLALYFIEHHAIKAYVGVEVITTPRVIELGNKWR